VSGDDAVWWCVGFVIGAAIVAAIGNSMVAERGRTPRTVPILLASAIVTGLIVGWALDAWIRFMHASATLPM
jgi:hypothetical protein